MTKTVRKTILIILDGYGINEDATNNAALIAKTPCLDQLFAEHPHTLLEASGPAVGLPDGQIGNSEVGHITMGCGSVVLQDLVRIDQAIQDGQFFTNAPLLEAMRQAHNHNGTIHLLGLVSDGGVHSHIRHLLSLIEFARHEGCVPIVHAILDGRDTAPRCAQQFIECIQSPLVQAGGAIATVMGRYYAMDRDKRWDRTEAAWRALTQNQGTIADHIESVLSQAYDSGLGDEFVPPTILPTATPLNKDDQLVLFNFRNDRPRQLIRALMLEDFGHFDRGDYQPIHITTMTEIDRNIACPIAFKPVRPQITLAKVISDCGLKQFHCAETEKYPHVTFFFNGGVETPLPGEDRYLVPSPKVSTYDLVPEMSAEAVAHAVVEALEDSDYSFIVVNFANMDMVGHTAVADPIIKAVETVDQQLGQVIATAKANDWQVLLTADHGNCDEMVDLKTGQPNTKHTMNPVPCLIISNQPIPKLVSGCNISSIAPTVLDLMGLRIPDAMVSPSILK